MLKPTEDLRNGAGHLESILARLSVLDLRTKSSMVDRPDETDIETLKQSSNELTGIIRTSEYYMDDLPVLADKALSKAHEQLKAITKYEQTVRKETDKTYKRFMRAIKHAELLPTFSATLRENKFNRMLQEWTYRERLIESLEGNNPYIDSGVYIGLAEITHRSGIKREDRKQTYRGLALSSFAGVLLAIGANSDISLEALEWTRNKDNYEHTKAEISTLSDYFSKPSDELPEMVEKAYNLEHDAKINGFDSSYQILKTACEESENIYNAEQKIVEYVRNEASISIVKLEQYKDRQLKVEDYTALVKETRRLDALYMMIDETVQIRQEAKSDILSMIDASRQDISTDRVDQRDLDARCTIEAMQFFKKDLKDYDTFMRIYAN